MKKIIIIIVLIILAVVGYRLMTPSSKQTNNKRPAPNVVVATVSMQLIRDEVDALGTSKANESITVTPKVSDVITAVNFDDGDKVDKGRLLVLQQSSEQSAKVSAAKIKLKDSQRELERIRNLVRNQTVAELEQDRLQTAIDTAKAELSQAQSALDDRRITAPFSGVLGLRQVSVGAFISAGEVITTLDDISVIKLDFSVPERFLQSIAIGKSVEAKVVAFNNQIFTGKVVSIDSRVNPRTRAVVVRAEIPNPDLKLLPGMLMTVKLIKQSRQALLVPEAAIIPIQNKHFVYVVNKDSVVERHQVTLGLRKRGWVEVMDGLELNAKIITRGILKVRPGTKVVVSESENFSAAGLNKQEPAA